MRQNPIIGRMIIGCSALGATLIVTIVIILMVSIVQGSMGTISWSFIAENPTNGLREGGIFPAIAGTFLMTIIMAIIGIPVGVVSAIYLVEYAKQDSYISKVVRFSVNTLAGVPSIVFGLFGLGFFVQFVGAELDQIVSGGQVFKWRQPNILWASLTMALLTLPVVIISVEEALRTIPRELREASLALGATKWQTIWKVVVPNGITGIMTGGILAVSRGSGEVAPILFTGVAYYLPNLPTSFSDQFMHLGYHIYIMSTQSPDVEATKGIQFATTLVLLALTFILNFTSTMLRYMLRRRARKLNA